MPTTTNFGWTTPADTDLVSQGAAAMRTLGGGIDTSLVKLKGGTTGQVLAKASNTDLDYSWVGAGWVQLATASLTGTTVSFTGISQSYEDLRIVLVSASHSGAGRTALRFGTASIDTGTNYRANYVNVGTAAWSAGAAATSLAGGATTATWTLQVFDIREYTRSGLAKMIEAWQSPASTTTPERLIGAWAGGAIQRIDLVASTSYTGGTVYIYGRA